MNLFSQAAGLLRIDLIPCYIEDYSSLWYWGRWLIIGAVTAACA